MAGDSARPSATKRVWSVIMGTVLICVGECLSKLVEMLIHKFVKVAWNVFCVASFHAFQLYFDSIPIRLHMLRMNTSNRVYKCYRVIHSTMCCNIWKWCYLTIQPPFICMNNRARCNMSTNDGEKCCCNQVQVTEMCPLDPRPMYH